MRVLLYTAAQAYEDIMLIAANHVPEDYEFQFIPNAQLQPFFCIHIMLIRISLINYYVKQESFYIQHKGFHVPQNKALLLQFLFFRYEIELRFH